MKFILTAAALLATIITPLVAQEFEEPPLLRAAEILKPEFAAGVRDVVPTYAGRNSYVLNTDVGMFEAEGNIMLIRRVREIDAIRRLQEVSRTDAYRQALRTAAKSPFQMARGLIEHPVSTVAGVPKGMWKVLNRAGQSVKERANGRERSEYEDGNAAELVGFAKAKREVALTLGVDPYSSNPTLQRELNGISWAAFAGKLTFSLATAPVGGGAGMALTASGVTNAFENAIRDQSPKDLRLSNLGRLLAMDVTRADANDFLNNPAFSPTVQTAIVFHLDSLADVANRGLFIRLASQNSAAEADAQFYGETARILAQLHAGSGKLEGLGGLAELPIALAKDGTVIMALEWDYAAWTENAATFVAGLKAGDYGRKPTGFLIALSGDASPLARRKLQEMGVTLATHLAPGPLK